MMRGKHGKKSRFPALAALALCAVLIVTFMPNLMFSANAEDENKIVTQITALAETTLTVPTGTSEEAVKKQLPISLSAKIRQADNSEKDETINGITWSSDQYKSDSAGTYKFTSGLPSGYQLADGVSMPSVNVTVRVVKEVESESGTSVDSGKIFGTRKSTVTQFTYPTSESLGSVGKYGVFARNYTQTGDMEGSVATENLDATIIGRTNNIGPSNYDPDESYNYIKTYSSAFQSHKTSDWIFGDSVALDNHYNNENGFRTTYNNVTTEWNQLSDLGFSAQNEKYSPYQINFDSAFETLNQYAAYQYNKNNTEETKVTNNVGQVGVDPNNYVVDIQCSEGSNIVNLKSSDLQQGIIKVTGPSNGNYSLIINITGLSESSYSFTKDVYIDNVKDGYSSKIGHVMFNFGSYNGTLNYPGNNQAGVILAPNATVKFSGGHHAGSVYANTIESSVEIHQIDFIPSTPVTPTHPSITFAVKKSFDGNYPDEKTFSFTLSGGKVENGKITNNIIKTATVDGNRLEKNVPFESITYQDAGTYKYTVSEKIPNNADDHHVSEGVKYDPTVYDVEVVTSKESAGNVKIDTVKYKKSSDTEYKSMNISNPEAFTFSNSSAPSSTTSVSVKKVWDDNNNQDGKRPDSIQLHLYADGTEVTSKALIINKNGNEWSYSFTDLPKNNKDGKEINYTVKEDHVTGYESSGDATKENNFTITNTHTPETINISGTKTWDDNGNQDGKRPGFITIHLLSNGIQYGEKKVIPSKDGVWSYSFEGLPKYANGKLIAYTITEDTVKDYSTEVNDYNITNSYTPDKTSVTVTKAWLDNNNADKKRPASIQVQLYANGEKSGDPVTLSESTNWTYTWSDLDAKKSGTDIKYTVKEVNTPDGYTSNVSGDAKTGFTITNTENTTPPTPNPQPTYTTYTVHKVWALGSGEAVPDSVQIQLYKNGEAYGSPVSVTRASGWMYTWTGLPQTENGKLNTWSVKEVDPDNQYTATVVNGTSSATVTNRSNNNAGGKTQVSVHKVWKLDNGRTAASFVQAQLYRNGEAYGDPVTLSAGNSWSHVWTGLTKTDAQGNTISWTVREVNVPSGFTSTVTGTDRSFTITNDDKPKDNHNKNNKPVNPNNNNNKPVTPNTNNKKNTPVNPGTPSIPKNTGTVVNRGTSAGTPRTGDQTSLGFWLAMLTAGAAGTAAAVLLKRRKSADEDRD